MLLRGHMVKTSISVGNCILCGTQGELTEEHIFADWISKVAPSKFPGTRVQLITAADHRTSLIRGPHHDLRIKVLCSRCNNDWGSRLQSKTARVLKPLIRGRWVGLTSSERSQLARWLSCFVIVREFMHPELVTIAAEERLRFRKTSIPCKGTCMWITPFEGSANHLAAWHRALIGMTGGSASKRPDTHFTVLAIGRAVFFVFGSSHEELARDNSDFRSTMSTYLNSIGMSQIWPLGTAFPEEKPNGLNDANFDELIPGASEAIFVVGSPNPIVKARPATVLTSLIGKAVSLWARHAQRLRG